MKKKFGFWLQIVTICLCVCAIVAGVYSATTASITASGKIAFTAHNCKVEVGGYIYGHAAGNVHDGLPTTIDTKDTFTTITVEGTANTGVSGTLDIGNRYFSDMESTTGEPAPIVIVITVKNITIFDVTVSTNLDDVEMPDEQIAVSLKDNQTSVLLAQGNTATFQYTLTLTPLSAGDTSAVYREFDLGDFCLPMSAVKVVEEKETPDIVQNQVLESTAYSYLTFEKNESASTYTANLTGHYVFEEAGTDLVLPAKVKIGGVECAVTILDFKNYNITVADGSLIIPYGIEKLVNGNTFTAKSIQMSKSVKLVDNGKFALGSEDWVSFFVVSSEAKDLKFLNVVFEALTINSETTGVTFECCMFTMLFINQATLPENVALTDCNYEVVYVPTGKSSTYSGYDAFANAYIEEYAFA